MEVIEITTTNKEFRYKAIDGTIFKSELECRRYEETALCVLKSRLKIKTISAWDFSFGYDDSEVEIVNGKKQDVLQYIVYHKNSTCSSVLKNTADELFNNYKNDNLLVWFNSDGEAYKMIWQSDYINMITDNCKIKE